MALPEDVLQRVRAGITDIKERIPDLEADIRDATKAGIDTTEQRKRLQLQKDRVRKLESVYGEKVSDAKRVGNKR